MLETRLPVHREFGAAFVQNDTTSARAVPIRGDEYRIQIPCQERASVTSSLTFMTFTQVMAALQISDKTLRTLILTGQLPATKVGAQWRFRSDDFENFGRHDWPSINAATSGTTASRSRGGAIAARPIAAAKATRSSSKSANGAMPSWAAYRATRKTGV
ncbi:hypothetical protein CSW59_00250 [Caulobacter sp. BP25]|nr:hypothetical protein CSW59_00250 [Caulobacter sp. BP25]